MRLLALALLAAACQRSAPARIIAAGSDTIVVNARSPTLLPIRVLDSRGRTLPTASVQLEPERNSVLRLSSGGRVTCDSVGDVRVRASVGDVSTALFVRCQPVRALVEPPPIELLTGGPPVPLSIAGIGIDNRPIMVLSGSAAARDSDIARIVGGQVYAKARGHTWIDVEVGDCELQVPVRVTERVQATTGLRPDEEFDSVMALAPGELRYWRIPRGTYDISLESDPDGGADSVVLGVEPSNCARYPGVESGRYECLARDDAVVVVRRLARTREPGVQPTSTIRMLRLPDAPAPAAAGFNPNGSAARMRAKREAACTTVLE